MRQQGWPEICTQGDYDDDDIGNDDDINDDDDDDDDGVKIWTINEAVMCTAEGYHVPADGWQNSSKNCEVFSPTKYQVFSSKKYEMFSFRKSTYSGW